MLISSIITLPEEADIPKCQICRRKGSSPGFLGWLFRRGGKEKDVRSASVIITAKPMISQWRKGKGKEIYLCNKHYRMLLKAFDEAIDRAARDKSNGGHLPG